MLPILGQTFLIWQFIFSGLLLKTKYNARHFAGAALVLLGLVVVNEPSAWAVGPAGAREARSASPRLCAQPPTRPLSALTPRLVPPAPSFPFTPPAQMLFPIATFTASTLMFAVDSIFKEKIFRDYRAKKGRQLDIFVVNTFGSCWQALFTFLLLPANAALRGVAPSRLPEYLRDGLACFVGCTPQSCALDGHSCGGAPLLPLLYIGALFGSACAARQPLTEPPRAASLTAAHARPAAGVNLALNVSALRMMRSSSAVVASLVSSIAVRMRPLRCFPTRLCVETLRGGEQCLHSPLASPAGTADCSRFHAAAALSGRRQATGAPPSPLV